MFSDKVNGKELLDDVQLAAVSMKTTTAKVDGLINRFNRAQGAVPRLFEDKQYGDDLLTNARQASSDLKEILRKVNSGQGSVGLAVNDPALYYEAKAMMAVTRSIGRTRVICASMAARDRYRSAPAVRWGGPARP